jgi:putative endonuclease
VIRARSLARLEKTPSIGMTPFGGSTTGAADGQRNREDRMRKPKRFCVYILTNRPRSHVLYTGVTGKLTRRVFQHKNKLVPGFTSRYNLTRLVYYESFVYPDTAIAREKEIKGWRRSKKIRLIESMNPHWHDLAESWSEIYKPEPTAKQSISYAPREIPRPAGESAGLRDDAVF